MFTGFYMNLVGLVKFTKNKHCVLLQSVGLIYETNVRPKFGRTVVSTPNLELINMDVSGGYDQISRQV